MEPTDQPLPPGVWAAPPAAAQVLILAQRECIRDLEACLGQTSANSSRPPSSDPPHAPVLPQAPPLFLAPQGSRTVLPWHTGGHSRELVRQAAPDHGSGTQQRLT